MSEMIQVPDGWEVTEFKSLVNNKTKKSNSLEYSIIVDLENIEQNNGELIFNSLIRDYPKDKIVFNEQNILFGKLRPYLRKYWYCSFEGSCTSELLVLEAKKALKISMCFM
jgi:type I restriction enzyme, S subunit